MCSAPAQGAGFPLSFAGVSLHTPDIPPEAANDPPSRTVFLFSFFPCLNFFKPFSFVQRGFLVHFTFLPHREGPPDPARPSATAWPFLLAPLGPWVSAMSCAPAPYRRRERPLPPVSSPLCTRPPLAKDARYPPPRLPSFCFTAGRAGPTTSLRPLSPAPWSPAPLGANGPVASPVLSP